MSGRINITFTAAAVLIFSIFMFSSCAEKFELGILSVNGGQVIMTPSDGLYSEGTRVTLKAVPDAGYSFTGWGNTAEYSQDSATSSEIEIVMPAESIRVTAGFTVPGQGWTFMVYMAGDNSLSSYVSKDINEIEQGLYDAVNSGNTAVQGDVRVLILADKSGSSDTRLYLASPDNDSLTIVSTVIVDGVYSTTSELNMADPDTLTDFISYGLAKYPSEYNALVLWNHGGGVKSLEEVPISKEICEDKGGYLYMNQVQTAVSSAISSKLDIIGIDACIMGEVETAYEMRNLADYFVASMAEEWGNGWGYNYIFNKFTSPGSPPEPAAMADILVTQFRESTLNISNTYPNTMTAVKTAGLENLKTEIDALAGLVYAAHLSDGGDSIRTAFQTARDASVFYYTADEELEMIYNPYHDLYSFCGKINDSALSPTVRTQALVVQNALAAVIAASYGDGNGLDLDYYETNDASAVRGLSIMIPHGENSYNFGTSTTPDIRSYYAGVWWYVSGLYQTTTGIYLGGLDFCTYDDTGAEVNTVETWRELFEAWYDYYPDINVGGDGQGYTPGTY